MNFGLKVLGYGIARIRNDIEVFGNNPNMKIYVDGQKESLKKYQTKHLQEACKELIKINKENRRNKQNEI